MKDEYFVSVIIPCYNQEKLVWKCLDSIPKRDDLEIIVINDGSTDRTFEALKKYRKERYKELKIISYDTNKGVSYARNQGLDMAKGTWVVMIDSDDYVFTDAFERIMDNWLLDEDMVYYNMEDNCKNIYSASPQTYKNRWGMFKFIRRSFIGDLRFEIGRQHAEDKMFTLELLSKTPFVTCTDILMYHYNYPREGSLTALWRG